MSVVPGRDSAQSYLSLNTSKNCETKIIKRGLEMKYINASWLYMYVEYFFSIPQSSSEKDMVG